MTRHERLVGDRYVLREPIGRGGMGDVYRAVDTRSGATVAVKVLREAGLEALPEQVRRFEREGEVLRRLNHPSIVKMLDGVDDPAGRCIVMEYVTGGSLADLLQREARLSIERVVEIGLDLADALAHAHRLGIVHRDLKPLNVLLAEDGTPRLTDFGLAFVADRSRLTESGTLVGTYAYLSPEACNGMQLDERTDIWALGVMLFEMLAGQQPFRGEQIGAVLTAILSKPTPDLTLLRPDAPPALVSLIERMLLKERSERIGSARQVGVALEAIGRGEVVRTTFDLGETPRSAVGLLDRTPTPAPAPLPPAATSAATPTAPAAQPPPAPRRQSPWLVVGPVAVGLLVLLVATLLVASGGAGLALPWLLTGVVAVVLAGVLGWALRPTNRAAPQPTETTAQQSRVEPVAADEYMVLVAAFEPVNTPERDVARFVSDTLRQQLELDIPFSNIRIRRSFEIITSDTVVAAAEATGATVVVWGDYDGQTIRANVQIGVMDAFPAIKMSRQVLERTANTRVELADERGQSLAPHVLQVVNVLFTAEGNVYETLRNIAMLEVSSGPRPRFAITNAATYVNRFFESYIPNTAQAITELDRAISVDGANPLLYVYRTAAKIRLGRFAEAQRDAQTARQQGPTGWTSPAYGFAYPAFLTGDFDTALASVEEVVLLREGDWFPLYFRGAVNYFRRDYEEVKADMRRSIALRPNANFPFALLVLVMLREGNLREAQQLLREARALFRDPTYGGRLLRAFVGGEVPEVLGPTFAAFGNLSFGRFDEAIAEAHLALKLRANMAEAYLIEGLALCNLGRYAEAEAAYSAMLASDPGFTLGYLLRAEARGKQGQRDGARADLQAVQGSPEAAAFAPALALARLGQLGCEQVLK